MRFFSYIILCLTLVFVANAAIQGGEDLTDPYEILEKHYEAIGGLDKLKTEKTRYSEGSIVIEGTGLEGTIKIWTEVPNKERQEVDLKILRQTSGDNGQFSWEVDTNGKLQIRRDEPTLQRRRVRGLMEVYDHLNPRSDYFSLGFEGVEKVDDIDCYIVTIKNSINEDVIRQYMNVNTFMLEKSVVKEPDVERHTRFLDYREVNGLKRSFRQEMEILPIGQKMTIQLTRFEGHIEIEPSVFEPPGEDVKDYRFIDGESAENVPFKFLADHIFISVNVKGKERLWILDSGASISVVDSAFAAELGLKAEGDIKGVGAGNTLQVSFVDLPPFRIEGIEFSEQKAASAGFLKPYAHRHFGLEVVGILGYDFLSRFVTRIDYASETLSFYESDAFEYRGKGVVLEAPLMGNTFSLPVTVDGTLSGTWSLDLGAGGVSFHYPFAEEHDLLTLKGIDGLGFGAGGESGKRTVQFEAIEWAGFTIRNPLISMPLEQGEGAFRRRELTGNLGNSLFRHFVLYLDYERQQVIIERGDNFEHVFPRDKSGLQLVLREDEDVEVVFVAQDTPAAKAGFQKGDIITAINSIETKYLGGLLAVRDLLSKEKGTKYTVTLSRDSELKEMTLKLQDLY
ncbi:MAG: aspartyl protease family protein [Gemmatimonadota bacterium]|nr:MAG: aspartyl protease family protein [Gemmatimonadota bacterium]